MGYRKADNIDSNAVTITTKKNAEPFPVQIFGEEKPIADNKIHKYLTDDVFYYANLITKIKKYGLPHIYKSWLDVPQWLMELIDLYDKLEKEYEYNQVSKQSN